MIMPNYVCERRKHVRVTMRRPAKVRCPRTGRTLRGHTVDLSPGGCLMLLEQASLLDWGQDVRVGIAQQLHRQGLMLADDVKPGRVVRSYGLDGRMYAAVAFDHATPLAEAG